jgi:hypothetical protein
LPPPVYCHPARLQRHLLQLGRTTLSRHGRQRVAAGAGLPLINAVSDMVKGYFNMGLARWGTATLLTISAAIGIILAMSVTGIWGWKV